MTAGTANLTRSSRPDQVRSASPADGHDTELRRLGRRACMVGALVLAVLTWGCGHIRTPGSMVSLGRGLVAVHRSDGRVFLSWRNLVNDPTGVSYNVYRSVAGGEAVRLNSTPLAGPTSFVDGEPVRNRSVAYTVRTVHNGREGAASTPFVIPGDAPRRPYLSIPLVAIEGYAPNDASAADLDGDGEFEIVLHQAGRGHDNSHNGETDPPILQAYKLDGALLWSINLGRNIREGAHYTQFMVYDLDGDGRAEVACKTADGTTDGTGKVIGDANADYVDKWGRILTGPEFLTVFDGLSGAELATVPYIPPRHPTHPLAPTRAEMKAVWGDDYGNRGDRFLACMAYLDGALPSLVMCRGYYSRTVLAAWDWRNGRLTQRWTFDSADPAHPECREYAGQGNHNLSVADVDGDGRDEIVYGAMCIDDNGKGLYTTRLGHGDAIHVSDLDPTRPGLEVFMPHENAKHNGHVGASLRDAGTGAILWSSSATRDIGRGMAADIDPRHPGAECWAANDGSLYSAKGQAIGGRPGSMNSGIWWDGDLLRELLDHRGEKGSWHGVVYRWNWQTEEQEIIWEDPDTRSNNWTKGNPVLSGDILGDWREEMIWRSKDNTELRIYTTTIPTAHRIPCLMQDRQYRLGITWQNVSYNQPPHPSYFLGEGMTFPPR